VLIRSLLIAGLVALGQAAAQPASDPSEEAASDAPAQDGEAGAESGEMVQSQRQTLPTYRTCTGNQGEVVVCGRRGVESPYRIPKALRNTKARSGGQAWGSRVGAMEDASRAGRPGSNSPVGSGGQSGQREEMLREWYEERREPK
jgi:hypothetical protein